jgi:hypothetical protein
MIQIIRYATIQLSVVLLGLMFVQAVQGQVTLDDANKTKLTKINRLTATSANEVTVTVTQALDPKDKTPTLTLYLSNGISTTLPFNRTEVANQKTSLIFKGMLLNLPDHFSGSAWVEVGGKQNQAGPVISQKSTEFPIQIDLVPPRITAVRPIEDQFGAQALVITLEDENLYGVYNEKFFSVSTKGNDTNYIAAQADQKFKVLGKQIQIPLKQVLSGLIEFSVISEATEAGKPIFFEDKLGNVIEPSSVSLAPTGQRVLGPAVDFPPNVVPKNAGRHSETNEIRPSSRVVTRVVRLYYYRNADRVAEIINRRTQQFNLSQATAKRNLANEFGKKAEDATVERRESERRAEQAARQTREAEAELQRLQMDAEEARTVQNNLVGFPNDSVVVADGAGGLAVVDRTQFQNTPPSNSLTSVKDFRAELDTVIKSYENQQAKVADLRAKEFEANNQARRNEDLESRLIRSQFLKEVEAAEVDPKTYAAADIDSVDPVMQTSVSVIGEGVIQLRGPIGGINQIRRMIHQIDVPVGQVKVDLETVQINGEKGPELEETIQLVEGNVNVGRFLTNQSLVFLSRSVSEIAAEVAHENGEPWQRDQLGRDMRYLYGFFGQDFVDTLHRMDSEFLHSENQILSLHSMDAISRNRALLLIALARNSVRQRILERFQQYVNCNLPQMEYNYRTINKTIPCKYLPKSCEECKERVWNVLHAGHREVIRYTPEMACEDAAKNYQFLNFYNFFAQGIWHDASLNPVQREFIRLAQIFKSQLIAEIELKQRIVERGLMDQKLSEDKSADQEKLLELRKKAVTQKNDLLLKNTEATSQVASTIVLAMNSMEQGRKTLNETKQRYASVLNMTQSIMEPRNGQPEPNQDAKIHDSIEFIIDTAKSIDQTILRSSESMESLKRIQAILLDEKTLVGEAVSNILQGQLAGIYLNQRASTPGWKQELRVQLDQLRDEIQHFIDTIEQTNRYAEHRYDEVLRELETFKTDWKPVFQIMQELEPFIPLNREEWRQRHHQATAAIREMIVAQIALKSTQDFLDQNRLSLPQIKLLDHLIDEHEEKAMNLLEGKRHHVSAIDNFLKRMTFALEDDFQVQFYDPALVCIRSAARGFRVTLSAVERTTVLGNNRELLKVLPQASMEFDLPNRKLRITEAMQGAKALVDDYGALLNDPTFLAAFQMMGGGAPAESIRKVVPGLKDDPNQQFHALPAAQSGDRLGASLQGLVPDPSIYSIETGTGWEVKPVIQPDGDSLVYDLNYLYHTELREPVRADEKHLGRIKRHLIHTQVQTSSFEMREVGRYQVALKVSRTGRGVPLLENTPVVGALFRPAPSAESSIQQNILLAKSVIYPTLYDLMGLSWAQHIAELGYDDIRNAGHVSRGRQRIIQQHVFDESSRNVDDFLQIKEDAANFRPDLYREYSTPSPYHPNGYVYPKVKDEQDPTRRGFRLPEARPEPFRTGAENGSPAPDFDDRFRLPIPSENSPQFNEELPTVSPKAGPLPIRPGVIAPPARSPISPQEAPRLRLENAPIIPFESNSSVPRLQQAQPTHQAVRPVPQRHVGTVPSSGTFNNNAVVPASYQVESLPAPPRR